MAKFIKFTGTVTLVLSLFCMGVLLADKETLRNDVIRLHVVANSDSAEDQNIKLAVRDTVLMYIQQNVEHGENAAQEKQNLQKALSGIEAAANDTLRNLGNKDAACVTLTQESFDVRYYDTFSLPSGVYESLRVEIGDAKGKNWWCVVFPSLCLPTTKEDFKNVAVSSGFEEGLSETLSGSEGYKIRFFFLDCIGKLENFFHES